MKNLGWLLLLLFFVFMLFVISSSNKNISTGTGELASASGEVVEDIDAKLDKLIESADESDSVISQEATSQQETSEGLFGFLGFGKDEEATGEKNDEESKSVDSDELQDTSASGTVDETDEQGFFSKLFKGDSQENEESQREDLTESEEVVKQEDSEEKVSVRDTLIGVGNGPDYSGKNIAKRTTGNKNNAYVDVSVKYPGVNLQTYVGKRYEVGVHALKLNNKYFSQTLGYMSEGDVVTQVSETNSYGCFQVEVEATNKKGYVCKKYLRETSSFASDNANKEEKDESQGEKLDEDAVHTAVGSYYRVLNPMDNMDLTQGDVLRQITTPKAGSCTEMKIVGSNVEQNTGIVVDICSTAGLSPMR